MLHKKSYIKKILSLSMAVAIVSSTSGIISNNYGTSIFATEVKTEVLETKNPIKLANLVKDKVINTKIGETKITGKLPEFQKFENPTLQKTLEDKVNAIYKSEIESLPDGMLEINFSFKLYSNEHFHSVLVYVEYISASSTSKVISINFNDLKTNIEKIDAVIGSNWEKLLNKEIFALINEKPKEFNSSFAGINENQTFYVKDNLLTLVFNQYEIAPKDKGNVELSFALNKVVTTYVEKQDYYVKSDIGTKFIPLKQITDAFGYTLKWNGLTSVIDIYKESDFISSLSVGENLYFKGKSNKKPLEDAPEINAQGRTCVPISFIETILEIPYFVNNNSTITFSAYDGEVIVATNK